MAFVYFGGHGVTDEGMTHAVCGKKDDNKRDAWTYQIEKKIRKLAKRSGSYVVALLDCGRQPWKINDVETAKTEVTDAKTKTDA